MHTPRMSASGVLSDRASGASEATGASDRPTEPTPDWLYLSKRLELLDVPAGRALDVIQVGPTVYYRLTPAVLVWLEHAVADLDAKKPTPEAVATVTAAMDEVYRFARSQFTTADIEAARRAGPRPLPAPEWAPTL